MNFDESWQSGIDSQTCPLFTAVQRSPFILWRIIFQRARKVSENVHSLGGFFFSPWQKMSLWIYIHIYIYTLFLDVFIYFLFICLVFVSLFECQLGALIFYLFIFWQDVKLINVNNPLPPPRHKHFGSVASWDGCKQALASDSSCEGRTQQGCVWSLRKDDRVPLLLFSRTVKSCLTWLICIYSQKVKTIQNVITISYNFPDNSPTSCGFTSDWRKRWAPPALRPANMNRPRRCPILCSTWAGCSTEGQTKEVLVVHHKVAIVAMKNVL